MKILLCQPPITEKNITSFMYPPLGLIALAAYLQQRNHHLLLFDANVEDKPIRGILNLVKTECPQVVGLGVMSVNIDKALLLARMIKSYNQNIIVVFGGVHPTVEPYQTLKNPYVDFIVRGEGELTLAELLDALEKNKKNYEEILGLGFKKKNRIIINSSRELIKNLDYLPIPAYHLLKIQKYRAPYTSRTPFTIMTRSRGCPFLCTFCGVTKMFGRQYRVQSPKRSIKEIEYLINQFGIKEIGFKDSEFTLNQKNVEDFCDLLIEKKYNLEWGCNGRVNHMNYALLNKMKKAGCTAITYGIESGDQKILDIMKKQIIIQQVTNAVRMTKKVGIKTIGNFMIGNPGDTKESIIKTIEFAKELKLDYAYFGFTTPFPGTELREQALIGDWILDKRMKAIKYEDCIMNATFLKTQELKTYLNKAYRSFYFRPSYVLTRLSKLSRNELYNSFKGAFSIIKDALRTKYENPTYKS